MRLVPIFEAEHIRSEHIDHNKAILFGISWQHFPKEVFEVTLYFIRWRVTIGIDYQQGVNNDINNDNEV